MGAPGEMSGSAQVGIGRDERERFRAKAVRAVLGGAAWKRAVEHSVWRECR
ncbi:MULTISPECIES: hypothetical protein [unclassified Streptomyces]|uniref:hypothetical protein n=1 Tax=unclassified Streptomyces TaxID=2593676 RepID=UPI0029A9A04E|nr:hypothetical protein [Streptomyces sp. FL07-04A]MDX3578964.1 hypothetical protein [Streptomyces sp. FL07-04A]